MKTLPKVALALLVALVFSTAARAAGVLEQVPSDAWVVVKVSNLQQTSDKVAKWAEQLGLAQAVPQFADPIGTLEKELKLGGGIDRSGEMAFVMVNPETAVGPDKALVVLVPSKDFKALTANLKEFKAGAAGGIATFKGDTGEAVYVTQRGNYAAFSPKKELRSNKPAAGGLKLAGVTAGEVAEKDIVVYANIPAMRQTLLPKLREAKEKLLQEIEKGGANFPTALNLQNRGGNAAAAGNDAAATDADAEPAAARQDAAAQPKRSAGAAAGAGAAQKKPGGAGAEGGAAGGGDANAMAKQFMPVIRAVVNQYLAAGEQFLTDADAATFSINLTDEGLNTSLMAEFKKDSYLGKFATNLKGTDQNLLAGLPNRKYFAFGGASFNSKAVNQLVSDALDPIAKELAGTNNPTAKSAVQLIDAVKKTLAGTNSMSFGYTVPTGALGADSIIQGVQVIRGDSKAIGEAQVSALKATSSMFQAIPEEAKQAGSVGLEVKQGVKTVGGVKLDQYVVNVEMDENDPQAAQAQQMMAFVYGPNGISGHMGAVDPKTYIVIQGGTEKLITDAVAAAKGGQDPFAQNENVKVVGQQLPSNKVLVEYVDLAQMITSGVKYAQGFGLPVKLQLPANLPPIGIAVGTESTAIRMDSHVPTTLIQSIVAAGMQAYMQMQGGDGAGAPEGL